jgi:hypothetical protein
MRAALPTIDAAILLLGRNENRPKLTTSANAKGEPRVRCQDEHENAGSIAADSRRLMGSQQNSSGKVLRSGGKTPQRNFGSTLYNLNGDLWLVAVSIQVLRWRF